MEILFLLVPLSLAIALAIGVVLWIAVEGGQFEDLEGAAIRVVADDDTPGVHGAAARVHVDAGQSGARARAENRSQPPE